MAHCTNCGAPLDAGVKFCTACGSPVANAAPADAAPIDVQPAAAQPAPQQVDYQPVEQPAYGAAPADQQPPQPAGYQQPQPGYQQPAGYQQPQTGYQQPAGYQQPQPAFGQPVQAAPVDSGNIGWGVLGFFFPIVGLILFLVWRNTKPNTAKVAGIGAIVGVVLGLVMQIFMH